MLGVQIISVSLKIYNKAHSWMINKIKCAFEVAKTFWTEVFFGNQRVIVTVLINE